MSEFAYGPVSLVIEEVHACAEEGKSVIATIPGRCLRSRWWGPSAVQRDQDGWTCYCGAGFNAMAKYEPEECSANRRGRSLLMTAVGVLEDVRNQINHTGELTFSSAFKLEAVLKAFARVRELVPGTCWKGELVSCTFAGQRSAFNNLVLRVQVVQEAMCMDGILGHVLASQPPTLAELVVHHGHVEICAIDQECVHHDIPVAADPTDAVIADLLWTTAVEHRIRGGGPAELLEASPSSSKHDVAWIEADTASSFLADGWHEPVPRRSDCGETVFIVKFNRCGEELRSVLHNGPELEPVRASATTAGHSCSLKSGASMFLYPEQYPGILAVLPDVDLRPHHVVVSEAFLPLLFAEIAAIPSKRKMRPSSIMPYAIVEGDSAEVVCKVERTFMCGQPRQLAMPSSVTQSTSEAPPNHVLNVRRRSIDGALG